MEGDEPNGFPACMSLMYVILNKEEIFTTRVKLDPGEKGFSAFGCP